MGLLTTPPSQPNIISKNKSISSSLHFQSSSSSSSSIVFENSMSQEYNHHHHHHHHGHGRGGGGGGNNNNNTEEEEEEAIFAFPNGFVNRSTEDDPSTTTDDPSSVAGLNPVVYESAGMLSEMFNFGGSNPGVANPSVGGGIAGGPHEWYGDHQQHQQQQQQHHHHMEGGGINAHNSAAAMQLFLTNAPPRSPSPPPPPPQQLLQPPPQPSIDAYHSIGNNNNPNFWGHHHNIVSNNNPGELGGIIEGQGLSLSLSSSLQHLEAAKHAEGNQIMFFNHHHHQQDSNSGVVATNAASSSSPTHFFKNLTSSSNVPGPGPHAHLDGYAGPSTSGIGYGPGPVSGSSMGVVNVLRNSKYAKPAQELLEEFCSVGRGQLNKPKLGRQNSATTTSGGGVAGSSSSVSKEPPQLSPADRIEHQRRKVKLLAMLDEVDRRYNHYCEQMQMVVNSFDLVMGYGGAIPYTALAQKAMSRHFRCLKDAVHAQLKHSCELLGEKDPTASSGLTKGETPRLKMLEQSLRQQRAFHQMGMMDQEAWRPQRGLPERSVNILRAWLFEHFLHPYPSDADKHLLARQTGLSRNQVSNWFINARVRLWKPMVEEMYQQEAKDRLDHHDLDHDHDLNPDDNDDEVKSENTTNNNNNNNNSSFPTTQQQPPSAIAQNPIANDTVDPTPPDSDTSRQLQFNQQPQSLVRHAHVSGLPSSSVVAHQGFHPEEFPDDDDGVGPATMIRFGSAAAPGDVSLTLGLRHAGNAPDKNSAFSIRDFEGC